MTNKQEFMVMSDIADRALDIFARQNVPIEKIDLLMDIENTHAIMPLKLEELLATDDGNFGHDIIGIYNHFNRVTKTMDNGFVPRYAKGGA